MTGRRDLYDQAIKAGVSASWDQEWDRAIQAYTAALQEFPNDTNALANLGFAYLQLDHLEDALTIYQRAAGQNPGDPLAPEKCGEILERLGRIGEAAQTYMVVAEIHLNRRDVTKAISNWSRVVRLTPDNLMAHSRLALACERTGQVHEAVLEYIEVARIFQRAREVDKAIQAASRAQQLAPNAPEARDALDKLRRNIPLPLPDRPRSMTGTLKITAETSDLAQFSLRAEEKSKPATAPLTLASPLDSAEEQATALLAEMLFDTDATADPKSSISSITRGTGLLRGDQTHRQQALQHLGQAIAAQTNGDTTSAINQYESALHVGFESAVVNFMLGRLYLKSNRPAEAMKRFGQAVNHEQVGVGALFGLGEAYYHQRKTKEAFQNLFAVLKRYDLMLIAPERQDALADAYEGVQEGLNQVSDQELAAVVKRILEFLSGPGWEERLAQAREQLDKSAEEGTVTPLADLLAVPGAEHLVESMRQIEWCIAREMWETAMEEAIFAITHSPLHLPLHIRMAEILVAQNKIQAAVDKYTVVAETYRIRGDYNRAGRLMQQVLKYNPLDTGLRTRLIDLYVEQGKTDAALTQFADLADTHYQLADLDTAYKVYGDALLLARQGSLRSWQVRLLHKLGDIELQRLNWRDAQTTYEQIKTLAPDDDIARATLIDLLFRLGNEKQAAVELDNYVRYLFNAKRGPHAVQFLTEALQAEPDSVVYLSRLARAYQDVGQKQEAIETYERAADRYLDLGQKAQAVESVKAILALQPANAQDYQQLLQQLQSA